MIVERIVGKDINSLEESDLSNIIGIPESRSIEFKLIAEIDPNLGRSEKKRK